MSNRNLIALMILMVIQLSMACNSKPKYIVEDIQLEEVKQEETDEPPVASKRLTCADTSSFDLGFFGFCSKQKADRSAMRLVLSVWKIDSSCIGVGFSRILPPPTDTSHHFDPSNAKNSNQSIVVSGIDYRGLNDSQIITKMTDQIKEIAGKESFHQLPIYAAEDIVLFTSDNRQIKLK